ncbi:MAG: ABC transporter permease [Mitsuaria chitosanitabida]|uniref:ABC transporter permease n=1 Tax=Roseateles chitosanitabidus TaxID=65048 RepID=UPI001B235B4C|nr:ABC transporter permease [Roseateles chitosanitabidus]MBO9688989.1 ABC transporter permease [Roseateles chitosanitabidus]
MSLDFFKAFRTVFAKEIVDALRDRRTLLRLMIPSVLMGPLMLVLMSSLAASLQDRAEQREVLVAGIGHAPTLRNYIERQTYTIKAAPADYEAQLRSGKLTDPVLVVPANFETLLAGGEPATLEIVSDSANQRAEAGMGALNRLVQGFGNERAGLLLAMRGLSAQQLRPLDVQERDLASVQARATRLTQMLPMFIMMAVLYGALTAALDSTAGERERGSLEPLLVNPAPHAAIVVGKWAAVLMAGLMVAVLSNLSFLPGQLLMRSDALAAMFQFGWGEALRFLLLQIPLGMGLSAVLMALAIRTKTFKEAQASTTLVITAVALTPMVAIVNPGGEASWHLWVPGLGQNLLMMQVLKGEALTLAKVLPTVISGAALTVAGLSFVSRSMRAAVAR